MNRYVRELINTNCTALENSDKSLGAIFNIMFSRPDEIMAEWLENGQRRFMTFGEGKKKIVNAAAVLRQKIGKSGGYVGLDLENGVKWIIAFWGLLMSGNKPYLINRRHPSSLTAANLKTLKVRYSVADGETSYQCMFIDARELMDAPQVSEDEAFGIFADELALSTSATTLNQVICIYTGAKIASQIQNSKEILMTNSLMPAFYKGALKQLAFLPFYHIFGLMAVYFWFAFFARPMVFLEDFSADSILGTVKALNVTHIFAVPMLWHTIEKKIRAEVYAQGSSKVKKFEKGLDLSIKIQKAFPNLGMKVSRLLLKEVDSKLFGNSPKFLISGGGYIKDSALYMMNGLGYALHNGYGMSETGITSVELRNNVKYRLENSIGKPFVSVDYEIGPEGTLIISGASLCQKMIRNGEETEIGNNYNSGDVVLKDENGNFFIKGRLGDRIIGESGENIDPDEVEKDLEFPDATNFCVFGMTCESGDEVALAVQIGRDLSTEKIKATADAAYAQSEKLPGTYQIKQFYFTFDPIASEQAIKVSRSYLKRGIAGGSITMIPFADVLEGKVSGREKVDPGDTCALAIRKIFAGFVEKAEEEICMDDHFIFDLGGTSLDYFSLVMRINEELGVNLKFDKDTACYTIRQFERAIEKAGQGIE